MQSGLGSNGKDVSVNGESTIKVEKTEVVTKPTTGDDTQLILWATLTVFFTYPLSSSAFFITYLVVNIFSSPGFKLSIVHLSPVNSSITLIPETVTLPLLITLIS